MCRPRLPVHLRTDTLFSFDTSPSVLNHIIIPTTQDEHASKKTKTTDSIASLIRGQRYTTLEQLQEDLDLAIENVFGNNGSEDVTTTDDALKEEKRKAETLKAELNRIIAREYSLRPSVVQNGLFREASEDPKPTINGHKSPQMSMNALGAGRVKTVLTLYGAAPTPRQLFSSIRRETSNYDGISDRGLPNGISTTRILPPVGTVVKSEKRDQTFSEVFAPSSTQPPLNPPRQSRRTMTRNSSIDWFNPVDAMGSSGRPNRRDSHSAQPQSTGKWLKYGKDTTTTQLTPPEAKRKQRERTLSFGDVQDSKTEEILSAQSRAEEDALFSKVYSSFAPDRDDTLAIVPENVRNMVWWNRFGQQRFKALENALGIGNPEIEPLLLNGTGETEENEDELFREAVERWEDDEAPPGWEPVQATTTTGEKSIQDFDEALREISELLEVLHSHQRVRNLTQTPSSRTSTGQNTQPPAAPSGDELEVYHKLRARLIAVVSSLPPYALAKLGGDKLGQFNVVADIPVASNNFRGTMQDEDSTAKAKYSSTTAAGISSRLSTSTPSLAATTSRQSLPTTSTPQSIQRNNYSAQSKVPNSYQPNQYSSRPGGQYYNPNTQHPYSSTAANANRYPYTKSSQYTQNNATPSNPYSSTHRPFSTTPGVVNQSYSSPSYSSLMQAMQTAKPAQPGYPPRPANTSSITYNSTTPARNASPQQPNNSFNYRSINMGQATSAGQPKVTAYNGQGSQYPVQSKSPQGNDGSSVGNSSPQSIAEQQAALISKQKALNAQTHNHVTSATDATQSMPNVSSPRPTPVTAPHTNGVVAGNGQ